MNILVLATSYNDAVQSIIRAGEQRGHTMIVKNPKWLYLLISENTSGWDAVFDGRGMDEKPEKIKIRDINAVISRIGSNLSYGTACLEHLNNNLRIFATQTSTGIQIASNKLISQQKFSQWHLRTPKTVLGDRVRHADWAINQVGGLPAIGKTLTGSLGNGVYILESPRQTNMFLQNFSKGKNKLLLQKFIPTGDQVSDIRAICIDGKVIVAMQRTGKPGELRANIDKGGTGKKIELSTEDQEICIRACHAVGLQTAGVDLIKDATGTTYVIEINGNYGYKIETLTETDISTPLIEYCEREAKNGNKANQDFTNRMLSIPQIPISGSVTDNKKTEDEARKKAIDHLRASFPFSAGSLSDQGIVESFPDMVQRLQREYLGK